MFDIVFNYLQFIEKYCWIKLLKQALIKLATKSRDSMRFCKKFILQQASTFVTLIPGGRSSFVLKTRSYIPLGIARKIDLEELKWRYLLLGTLITIGVRKGGFQGSNPPP